MKQRDRVAMTEPETAALLAASRKLQLATLNADGSVHLVTMFYAMVGGQIAFWTYRASQKARNLARDPRVTCLVETGEEYFDLRGVQVQGTVRCVEDPDGVLGIGRAHRRRHDRTRRPGRWTTTSRTPRASASATSCSRGGSSPGITASCSRRADRDQGCWLLTETTSPVR